MVFRRAFSLWKTAESGSYSNVQQTSLHLPVVVPSRIDLWFVDRYLRKALDFELIPDLLTIITIKPESFERLLKAEGWHFDRSEEVYVIDLCIGAISKAPDDYLGLEWKKK